MAKEIVISDEMKAQIGKESPPWLHEVTTTSVRMFALWARQPSNTEFVMWTYDDAASPWNPAESELLNNP